MRPVALVVLGKYKAIFEHLVESIKDKEEFKSIDKVLVRDGEDIPFVEGWTYLQGPEKFSMAGNGNIGLKYAVESLDCDILYCGDDVRFISIDTIKKLQDAAYSDKKIGIISPRLIGRGSPTLISPPKSGVTDVKPMEMWFPCVYIKKKLIQKIGYLDEQFSDFGCDDLDFCIRTLQSGYKLCVTPDVAVKHEASPEGGPTTFCKKLGLEEQQRQQQKAVEKILLKYEVSVDTFNKFLETSDCSILENKIDKEAVASQIQSAKDDARALLKTRSLYLATPAYGGNFSVNYVNSLINLVNLLRDFEVPHTISFIYNESLITRARNRMVRDFRQKSNFTDFFFIDADIGFDPRDIINLMLQPEMIIGAPCVRKNLRIDRVVNAARRLDKEYTIDELRNLLGEFVVNFPPGQAPDSIELSKVLEVQDVGTGLLRVKREAFDKIVDAFPERWTMPMSGEEGGKVPTYMFFQAEADPDTAKNNASGFPDYIPEDYAFCRLARKAGMKIHMAPWLKTNHMGSYLFEGDLLAVSQAGGGLR